MQIKFLLFLIIHNLNYNNSELNSLSYEEALKYDKRSFFQYYISLLKINQLLLFSFYPNEDYNSKIIKMFLFFFFVASEFSINALFFMKIKALLISYIKFLK